MVGRVGTVPSTGESYDRCDRSACPRCRAECVRNEPSNERRAAAVAPGASGESRVTVNASRRAGEPRTARIARAARASPGRTGGGRDKRSTDLNDPAIASSTDHWPAAADTHDRTDRAGALSDVRQSEISSFASPLPPVPVRRRRAGRG